jgi:hypothetical protein
MVTLEGGVGQAAQGARLPCTAWRYGPGGRGGAGRSLRRVPHRGALELISGRRCFFVIFWGRHFMAELALISTWAKSLSLGGGMPTIHSSTYYIFLVLCISMFRFLFFDCSCSYYYFPKHKKTKNISVVSLCLPFSFLALVCFTSYFRFDIRKIQKYFALFAFFLRSLLQNLKTQKYLLFFFGFVKFVAEFSLA